jgi:hypothetical protein
MATLTRKSGKKYVTRIYLQEEEKLKEISTGCN